MVSVQFPTGAAKVSDYSSEGQLAQEPITPLTANSGLSNPELVSVVEVRIQGRIPLAASA